MAQRWSPVALLCASAGCSSTAHLEAFPVEAVEESLTSPTGTLEQTDALGLAYSILATDRFMYAVLVAADQVPGVRRSNAYSLTDTARCTRQEDLLTRVDYSCLGFPRGELHIKARARTPNENGDYDLELLTADLAEGDVIDGTAVMRVAGVANPTATERTLIVPIARFNGFPDHFTELEQVAVRVSSARGEEGIDCLSSILGYTFVFHVQGVDDQMMQYTIRDAKNVWTCRSELDGRRLGTSECRTPVGQGDYAALHF